MLSFNDIQQILADAFFNGSMDIAGTVIYIGAIFGILAITRNPFFALVTGMGVTLLFTTMGVLSTNIAILMIIVSVLGLAYTSRNVWRD